mgnify:CR=1 FL=1
MLHSSPFRFLTLLTFLTGTSFLAPSIAETVTSPGISGHKPNVWGEEPNWTHTKGNPSVFGDLTWTLAVQDEKNPALTSPYQLMEPGTYVDYYFIWQAGPKSKDPIFQYRGNALSVRPKDSEAQHSASCVLLVKPASSGNFKVKITGEMKVRQPTAGFGQVTIYTLSSDRKQAKELATFKLNADVSGSYGSLPSTLEFKQTVELPKDTELALRVQAVNPGPATCGGVNFNITHFSMTQE